MNILTICSTVVLITLLAFKEIARAYDGAEHPRRLGSLDFVIWPLLALVVVLMLIRMLNLVGFL